MIASVRSRLQGTFGKVKLVQHKKTQHTFALKIMDKVTVVAYRQQTNVINEKTVRSTILLPVHGFTFVFDFCRSW